jgi:hypothetical protein
VRTNILTRRFKRCSLHVKNKLFRSFCICMYDSALWNTFTSGIMKKFESAYNKCLKSFFGFSKYSSVTAMLLQLGLPSFTTIMHNYRVSFNSRVTAIDNRLVQCVLNYCTSRFFKP